jgi:CheY-like chemotaxis protein/HPt (histidine-containing phosphotransfer) domain-containing protein
METPRLLLVEDDATSRLALGDVLRGLPAVVDLAADCAQAMQRAAHGRHALWLLDVELPDGDGISLLQSLRNQRPDGMALAHTASDDPALHARLRASGFLDVIRKPLPARDLLAAVRRALAASPGGATGVADVAPALPAPPGSDLPHWDDAAACRALGSAVHVDMLRGQFLASLAQDLAAIEAACHAQDHAALRHHLHRLRAACGFTGASRLAAGAAALRDAVSADARARALASVRAACEALLAPR